MKDQILLKCLFLLFITLGSFPETSHGQATRVPARVVLPVNETSRIVLKGTTHPMARPQFDAGIAPDNLPMQNIVMMLQRSPAQEAELQQLLLSQQTKNSPNFHKWLTPAEFGSRFGPADADIQAIITWLVSHGFSVEPVSGGRTFMKFSGTAGQVKNAFHTEIHKYLVKGKEHWANNKDAEIPRALAPAVRGVLSFHDFSRTSSPLRVQNLVGPQPGGAPRTPEATLTGCTPSGASCYGVGPADFAAIYDVSPVYASGTDGTGQTIAIASSTNIHLADTQHFRQIFNLPVNDPNVIVIGPDPGVIPANEGFTNLQVEWAGAVAPKATIDLVVTESTSATEGANLSAISIVNGNMAPILTLNYMQCEGNASADGALFYSILWEEAAAQGITVVVPAGDSGAAACDSHLTEIAATQPIGVNAIASTPYNVAVGGTDFNQVGIWSQYWNTTNDPVTQASAKGYIPEETWNDTCAENGPNGCANPNTSGSDLVAGGGGVSIYNPIPVWQASTGFPSSGGRVVPDIAMFSGDGNNGSLYLVCQGDANANGDPSCNLSSPYLNIQGAGGTSASAAVFAGVMALVNQSNGRGPQGNANFVLYALAANPSAGVFHDITEGNTSVACVAGSTLSCNNSGTGFGILADNDGPIWSPSPGYDLTTGWGSIDVNNLVTKWSSIQFQQTTTTIVSTTPATPAHGTPVTFNITVTSSGGTPTGDVALMVSPTNSNSHYAADVFRLTNGAINASTKMLPGGAYSVVAHYAGDGTFAPSDSAPFPITVTPQGSQTTIAMEDFSNGPLDCFDSGQQEFYASVYYLRVVVGNPGDIEAQPSNCYPLITSSNVATGTVTITDNGSPLGGVGTFALNGRGFVEIPTQPVALGNHQITATYSGDSSYASSTAGTQGSIPIPFFFVSIERGRSQTLLSANPTLVAAGQNVVLTATVRNTLNGTGAAAPSGQVTFSTADGTALGTANLGPNPNPSSVISSVAVLNYAPTQNVTVTGQYAGDANYAGSTATSPVAITIGIPDFSLASNSASISLVAGQQGTAAITVSPSLGFAGTVALACPAATTLPVGMTCSLNPSSVVLAGDGKTQTSVVTLSSQAPSTISVDARPSQHRWGAFSAEWGLALAALLFFGASRKKQCASLCAMIAIGFYCASCANIAGSGSSKASSLTLTTSAVKTPVGNPLTLTAAVSADHNPSGTVDFLDNGVPIAQGVAVNAGRATATISTLALGTHPLTASYSGDGDTNPSQTATPLNQVITGNGQFQITATSGTVVHNLQVSFVLR